MSRREAAQNRAHPETMHSGTALPHHLVSSRRPWYSPNRSRCNNSFLLQPPSHVHVTFAFLSQIKTSKERSWSAPCFRLHISDSERIFQPLDGKSGLLPWNTSCGRDRKFKAWVKCLTVQVTLPFRMGTPPTFPPLFVQCENNFEIYFRALWFHKIGFQLKLLEPFSFSPPPLYVPCTAL